MDCLMTNQDKRLVYLLSCLPRSIAVSVNREITHFVKHKGVDFTINRLKDLKAQLSRYGAGSPVMLVRSHADGTPKGVFRSLWKQDIVKSLRALNVYTSYVSPEITERQARKFLDSVQPPTPDALPEVKISSKYVLLADKLLRDLPLIGLKPFIRGNRKCTLWNNETQKFFRVPELETSYEDHLSVIYSSDNARQITQRHAWAYAGALGVPPQAIYDTVYKNRSFEKPWSLTPLTVGTVGYIQEKGGKLRVVANPFRIHQAGVARLGAWALRILEKLPWDCTHDQESGQLYVKECLSLGQKVHGYDLSDATNLFPLELQTHIMRKLVAETPLERELELFVDLSRGRWNLPKDLAKYHNRDYVQWTVGQPLGLYPSFAIFAISHGFLVRNIELDLGVSNTFRIIGDDIVISNDEVAKKYHEVMTKMGCKINLSKSLVSTKLVEFAGKLINKDEVLPVYKWAPFSAADPLGPLRCLGWEGIRFVPKHVRKTVSYLASIPQPWSLGLNPGGLTLASRTSPVTQTIMSDCIPQQVSVCSSTLDAEHRIKSSFRSKGHRPPHLRYLCFDDIGIAPNRGYNTVDKVTSEHYNVMVREYDPLKPHKLPNRPSGEINSRSNPFSSEQAFAGQLSSIARVIKNDPDLLEELEKLPHYAK